MFPQVFGVLINPWACFPLHFQDTDVPNSALSRCLVLSDPDVQSQKHFSKKLSSLTLEQGNVYSMFKQENLLLLTLHTRAGSWGKEPEVLLQQQQLLALSFPGHFKSWIVAGFCLCPLEARNAFCWVFNLVDSMTLNCIIEISSTMSEISGFSEETEH